MYYYVQSLNRIITQPSVPEPNCKCINSNNKFDGAYLLDQLTNVLNKKIWIDCRRINPFSHDLAQGLCSLDHLTDGWQQ